MKSYFLAIVTTMFLSALFAYQNIGDVTVRFLLFEKTMPQGVWEVVLFCAGAAVMWFFSIFSGLEIRSKYIKKIEEKDAKIAALEQEKKDILAAAAFNKSEVTADTAPMNDTAQSSTKEEV
ncbi:MAG: LapA family protein [Synergistes sp.]|nr:LapA family protein [Synergistes sp.]